MSSSNPFLYTRTSFAVTASFLYNPTSLPGERWPLFYSPRFTTLFFFFKLFPFQFQSSWNLSPLAFLHCTHLIQVLYFAFFFLVSFCRVWFCSGGFRDRMEMGKGCISSEVVVGDSELLGEKMAAIRTAGPTKLQVASCVLFVRFKPWIRSVI